MAYEITWSPGARNELRDLEGNIAKRIVKRVRELVLSPYHFVEKLTDSDDWKLRIGDYRVILDITEERKEIHVLKVGHRKNIYKK